MYQCLLEECTLKGNSPQERKDHCIKEHKFPSKYRFDDTQQLSKRMVKHATDESKMIVDEQKPSGKTKSKNSFSFGHQTTKTFNSKSLPVTTTGKSECMKNSLEDSKTIKDLLESLPAD